MSVQSRYAAAAHAVQSGVAHLMQINPAMVEPKHLRVGIDLSKAEQAGLVTLLIEKGIFTADEYFEAIATAVEQEKTRLEGELSQHYSNGRMKVTLA